MRGATVAAYHVSGHWAVSDVTGWGDTPEVKLPAIRPGDGPAIKIMDASMIHALVRDALFEAAQAVSGAARSVALRWRRWRCYAENRAHS